ncbi:hypothetical protein PS914_02555 [Pseudomonas fluorescens]|uniref:hypothetical protein n=1 Tax=Pseudomonas fluorescens TaxID=294 RepID=UPI001241B298|nr:hypothetical protein [Pseudomonas fluorescens]VVP84799.1 hypothetical protein PS914_02555 [Pseudomonas fluorescens]
MHLEQRLEFIDSLPELPVSIQSAASPRALMSALPHDINKPTASVMPDTIDAFLPGVTKQIIDDVNLCKLVMQNAATKLYPDDGQLIEWYNYYVGGLDKLGWTLQTKNMEEVTIRKTGLTMDQIALEIAAGLVGANAATILANVAKIAVETVKKDPGAIQIFDRDKKLGTQAKFDIAPVWVDTSGQPNMILNCIFLDARESTRGILFWKSTSKSTTVKTGAVRTYLDTNTFSALRNGLYEKYTAAGKNFIKDLPDF